MGPEQIIGVCNIINMFTKVLLHLGRFKGEQNGSGFLGPCRQEGTKTYNIFLSCFLKIKSELRSCVKVEVDVLGSRP